MKEILDVINNIKDDDNLNIFGKNNLNNQDIKKLEEEINNLTINNHYLSFMMIDINTLSGISYKSNRIMCGQSTIKAIYVASLLDARPELFDENMTDIRKAIEISDNEAYEKLRNKYGTTYLEKWCKEVGVENDMLSLAYPRTSVKDLCRLWVKMYIYFTSDKVRDELKNYQSNSLFSSAKEVLGKKVKLYSKAGWENGLPEDAIYHPNMTYPERFTDKDPYNDECAINDTGVVFSEIGPYIFAVFTDYPYGSYANYIPENPLNNLTLILYNLHNNMCA